MPRSRKVAPTSTTWSDASDFGSAHFELSLELGTLDSATAEAAAQDCGAVAVTFSDAADDPVLEPLPGEFRLWRSTRMQALFDAPASPAQAAALQARLAVVLGVDPLRITAREIAGRAWEREWLRDFHALRFGQHLWVCPWHETVADPQAVVVRLDPGLAFGTGTHPSTALCLDWLDARLRRGTRVIDYGCGSGVLALAAAKLGAAAVHCFDIDPQAQLATRQNATANEVAERIHVHETAAGLPQGSDVLLANILSGPLCALAADFATLVRPQGQVVLAGLLQSEAAEVTAAYAPWFDVEHGGARDGWLCLAGLRR